MKGGNPARGPVIRPLPAQPPWSWTQTMEVTGGAVSGYN
ncbi:hypothetical protein ES332_A09G260900v1 [Gossypium tomentosum]|uniref:Uncharacterized protein n=1 Tax=Gossypium tomentosum TaxID=34277 RepID=A0A5D2P737_GOSTO|nr:hypothetical protein ES332_A09G260900v1 [Gossypium tomentosum]